MTEHFNGLTEAEAERLALVIEECSEVQKAASKILRHGFESCNPLIEKSETNRQALAREMGDLLHVFDRLATSKDVDVIAMEEHTRRKECTIRSWLHHQEKLNETPNC